MAVFSGAVFVLLYSSVGARHPFLAVGQSVAAGQVITASDLVTVRVSDDPALHPIPAADVGAVVGRRAAVALVPGTLLVPADVTSLPLVHGGDASVGLSLKYGQFPAGLAPGDAVMVVLTATPAAVNSSPTGDSSQTQTQTQSLPQSVIVGRAVVLAVASAGTTSGAGEFLVTLSVPDGVAPEVVVAASAGDIGLAQLGAGGGS